ncbi:MAG: hypothetical protein Q4G22_07330 [Paracoccus sp. (in: a-proteobacteria)]|uniref:hypothetical protein n=1 Tax=Paracoccus sp. TaxID=267 RepID=UPI0026DEDF67|nr:hypothetical protein [Paracoccus sp. (in: a-proteobacteria)]MDO5631634.1 hypothetical protein [Paracoccus sp. (in: a-proteobacteria)]
MGYRLLLAHRPDPDESLLLFGLLRCYDTIGDPSFTFERDHILHERSAYHFIYDDLSPMQRNELQMIDDFWRAHPVAFDDDFWTFHHWTDKKTELRGWVEDEQGRTPHIPHSHWWWWPLLPDRPEKRTPPWLRGGQG